MRGHQHGHSSSDLHVALDVFSSAPAAIVLECRRCRHVNGGVHLIRVLRVTTRGTRFVRRPTRPRYHVIVCLEVSVAFPSS